MDVYISGIHFYCFLFFVGVKFTVSTIYVIREANMREYTKYILLCHNFPITLKPFVYSFVLFFFGCSFHQRQKSIWLKSPPPFDLSDRRREHSISREFNKKKTLRFYFSPFFTGGSFRRWCHPKTLIGFVT